MSVLRKLQSIFPEGKVTSKRWFNICCLDCANKGHTPDTKNKMGINYIYGYTHCFRCKTRHKLTYFLNSIDANYNNDDFIFEDNEPLVVTKTEVEFPNEFINVMDLFDDRYPIYTQALEYIEDRIGLDLALKLNVGFCHIGKYANRIIIPIFDKGENIIYFVARSIFKFIEPKILNPVGERRSILYNWNTAQNFSEIYIMEGIFGALTVYPYGVATLGKEITEEQILVILRSNIKIVNIVLDGNAIEDAYKVAAKIRNLTSRIRLRVYELKKEAQPDDYSFEHLIRMKTYVPFYNRIF